MCTKKNPSEGGSGGKRGHSNMEHWFHTDEIKKAARVKRRQADKNLIKEEYQADRLKRYWFRLKKGLGYGVTAYNEKEAKELLSEAAERYGLRFEVVSIIENIDIRDLDQKHVVPNMGPPNLYGVWFPKLNL